MPSFFRRATIGPSGGMSHYRALCDKLPTLEAGRPSVNLTLQRTIREYEARRIISLLPRHGSILEIGAGAGWQAKMVAQTGLDISAIDLPTRSLLKHSEFHIIPYDGHNIPFPDGCFDAVYTSNVLDHIPHVLEFQKEIHRVLKPDGMVVHVLPTTAWRFWTIVTHYPNYLKQVALLVTNALAPKEESGQGPRVDIPSRTLTGHLADFFSHVVLVPRLGERGNSITELFLFSQRNRRDFFRNTGWSVESRSSSGLFYSGNKLLGSLLGLEARHALSEILGSSGAIYVLRKADAHGRPA